MLCFARAVPGQVEIPIRLGLRHDLIICEGITIEMHHSLQCAIWAEKPQAIWQSLSLSDRIGMAIYLYVLLLGISEHEEEQRADAA